MAKGYAVNAAWHSPGLDRWITRDTAYLVAKLPDAERKHALDTGKVVEVELPPGAATLEDARRQIDEERQARRGKIRRERERQSEKAIKHAKAESGSGPVARTEKGGA